MVIDNEANFAENQAVLDNFRSNPLFSTYWKNWKRCQNWVSQCQQTFEEFQRNVAWQKAQDDIDLMLSSEGSMEVDEVVSADPEKVEVDDEGYAEFARQSQEHRIQRKIERARQAAANASKYLVEYIDASDIGIHGIVSKDISVKVFGQERLDRLEAMKAKYGAHAERILTLEVNQNFKFDQFVSKYNAQLWPNIPLHLPALTWKTSPTSINMEAPTPKIRASSAKSKKYRFHEGARVLAPVQDANICTSRTAYRRRRGRPDEDVAYKLSKKKIRLPNKCESPSPDVPVSSKSSYAVVPADESVTCEECGKVLKNKLSFNTHRNYMHGRVIRASIKCPEPDCPTYTTTMNTLVSHLVDHHGYPLKRSFKEFSSMSNFMSWFKELISDGSVEFAKASGMKERSQHITYYCAITKRKQRDPNNPDKGCCPAYIRLSLNKGSCSVRAELQLSHIGHECKPKYETLFDCVPLTTAYEFVENRLKSASKIFQTRFLSSLDAENHPTVQSAINLLEQIATNIEQFEAMFMQPSFPDLPKVPDTKPPILIEDFSSFLRTYPGVRASANCQFRCQICNLILPSYNEFMIHRTSVHQIVHWQPMAPTIATETEYDSNEFDFPELDPRQICEVCCMNFEDTLKEDLWYCELCEFVFHKNCKTGHVQICKGTNYDLSVPMGVARGNLNFLGVHNSEYYDGAF